MVMHTTIIMKERGRSTTSASDCLIPAGCSIDSNDAGNNCNDVDVLRDGEEEYLLNEFSPSSIVAGR